MSDEEKKEYLEASDQDLHSLTEYLNDDENAEVYREIEDLTSAEAQKIADAVTGNAS